MTITVYGTPAPQGSKRHVGNGVMIESSKKVKPWREAVKWAVIEHGGRMRPGPVAVDVTFTMQRPKKYLDEKYCNVLPSTRPDLSKLIRSTEDALTDAGAWDDDARVVECFARKVYPGQHPDSLATAGAVIRLRSLA